jgi:hypothetical protein
MAQEGVCNFNFDFIISPREHGMEYFITPDLLPAAEQESSLPTGPQTKVDGERYL